MKTKKSLIVSIVALVMTCLMAIMVGCSSLPKSYSLEGDLQGEKIMPAYLTLNEDGTVYVEYKMTMGVSEDQAKKTPASKNGGSWTQDESGITSVKILSTDGETYDAVIDQTTKTITIGYSLDFTTFTVSVNEAKTGENAKNFVFSYAVEESK